MKRTVPLLITAVVGIVLIISSFIPYTEEWGEKVAVWFDVLAAIAFVLGGGNLMKVHLKKISDLRAGWGYSAITLIAFFATLIIGLTKWRAKPAAKQEFYGETFVKLDLSDLPKNATITISGTIPQHPEGKPLPATVREQLSEKDGKVQFIGWMDEDQKKDLIKHREHLEWQCLVEKLAEKSKPPAPFQKKLHYRAKHGSLSFEGAMSSTNRDALIAMNSGNSSWETAIDTLYKLTNRETEFQFRFLPHQFAASGSTEARFEKPKPIEQFNATKSTTDIITYQFNNKRLKLKGPLTVSQRAELEQKAAVLFPLAMPLMNEDHRNTFLHSLQEKPDEKLNEEQLEEFHRILDGTWNSKSLIGTLEAAGKGKREKKSYCEMYEEKKAGVKVIDPLHPAGEDVSLSGYQKRILRDREKKLTINVDQLVLLLRASDEFSPAQEAALKGFFAKVPSQAERNKKLGLALLAKGALTPRQRIILFQEWEDEFRWKQQIGQLFLASQQTKYPWSGDYRGHGTPFWWIYEYVFKPLTATMFAMLAFYVASASFRAFRAKNFEAILLLGTAFIILLGRTSIGVSLTSHFTGAFSFLQLDQLYGFIMGYFNTAGNRAIMIGIALGIASTSLKVIIGVDRSYLGSQED